MLNVQNISAGYGKKQVLYDVSFTIDAGDILLLAGSNGSGKSTLLKTICGLLPIWGNGKVSFDKEDITGKPAATLLKKGMLFIPQKDHLFPDHTVRENLLMAGLTLDSRQLKREMEHVLSVFPSMTSQLRQSAMKLSGGEQRSLSLAMAMLHRPKLILLDEPFTGLSPRHIAHITEQLCRLNQNNGITLLIVEHRVRECLQIANKLIGLKGGSVVEQAVVDEHFSMQTLTHLFI